MKPSRRNQANAALQDLMVGALTGVTGAGSNVFAPRDWPTSTDEMPIILVQSPSEHKQGLGRSGAPQFTVNTTIRVVARVSAKGDTGDKGAQAALAAVGVLRRQIEVAALNVYGLRRLIEAIEIKTRLIAAGEPHVAELVMDFMMDQTRLAANAEKPPSRAGLES